MAQTQDLIDEKTRLLFSPTARRLTAFRKRHTHQRRSPMQTTLDVLTSIANGSTQPTHIMYSANLSWSVMTKYLQELQAAGYIVKTMNENTKYTYSLTPQGFEKIKQCVLAFEGIDKIGCEIDE